MKKLTSIILLSLSVLLISGCGKVVEESELNFRNGKFYLINSDKPFSGKCVGYYKNGQLQQSERYKNGLMNGSFERYYENGQLMFSGSMKNGKLNGLHKKYYKNGYLLTLEDYKDGERHGLFESYHPNGKLNFSEKYKNGKWIPNEK